VIRHLINLLLWALPPSRCFAFRRLCLRLAGVSIAPGAAFCGRGWIYGRGRLAIGDDSWLSPGVIIYTHLDVSIVIGARCDIGPGVEFIVGSHAIGDSARRAGPGSARAISVGDGCWLGAGSKILGGVTVGSGSVIAVGAVVLKDVPPNTLYAGVPAVLKRTLD
jgi:maltose O-acetyltransferase